MDQNAMFKLTYGLYVVGAKNQGKLCGCIVDAVMQTTVEPPTLVMCCNKTTCTHDAVVKTKEFTLSVLSDTTDPFIIGLFGFQSCRDAKKWEKIPHDTLNGLPVLKNAAAYLRCKVREIKDLSTHTLFFCDVVETKDGEGKALSYTEYRNSWKTKVSEAFKAGVCAPQPTKGESKMAHKWICKVCGYEYDESIPFEELPDNYVCPVCGAGKDEFEKVEINKTDPRLKEKWVCTVCGYVYDGDIPFENQPDTYVCPICNVPKSDFKKQ